MRFGWVAPAVLLGRIFEEPFGLLRSVLQVQVMRVSIFVSRLLLAFNVLPYAPLKQGRLHFYFFVALVMGSGAQIRLGTIPL